MAIFPISSTHAIVVQMGCHVKRGSKMNFARTVDIILNYVKTNCLIVSIVNLLAQFLFTDTILGFLLLLYPFFIIHKIISLFSEYNVLLPACR
jgi:hypothetical protein